LAQIILLLTFLFGKIASFYFEHIDGPCEVSLFQKGRSYPRVPAITCLFIDTWSFDTASNSQMIYQILCLNDIDPSCVIGMIVEAQHLLLVRHFGLELSVSSSSPSKNATHPDGNPHQKQHKNRNRAARGSLSKLDNINCWRRCGNYGRLSYHRTASCRRERYNRRTSRVCRR